MIDDTLFEAEEKMDKAVTVAQEDFSNIRTGRVTPAVFSKITAEYYGTQTPLNQLASFHFPELTEERRREYVKTARSKAEDSRISIRNIRRHAKDALDKMIKTAEAGED